MKTAHRAVATAGYLTHFGGHANRRENLFDLRARRFHPSCFAPTRFAGLALHCAKRDALRNFSEGGQFVYYVYLIKSVSAEGERYLGMTTDLKERLHEHNAGKSFHTSKFKPWKLTTYIAFTDPAKAEAFERYLKSGSGHAFARKRLW
jgi:predicted GIY-YIG superfamily endonuclease